MNAMPIPPNVNMDDKFYIGFYTDGTLLAVMDLIRIYPPKRNNEQTETGGKTLVRIHPNDAEIPGDKKRISRLYPLLPPGRFLLNVL